MEHREDKVKEKFGAPSSTWGWRSHRRMEGIGSVPLKDHPGCCAENGMQRSKGGSNGTSSIVQSLGSGQRPVCARSEAFIGRLHAEIWGLIPGSVPQPGSLALPEILRATNILNINSISAQSSQDWLPVRRTPVWLSVS